MKRFVSRISAVLLPARLSAKASRMARVTPPRTPMHGVSAANVKVQDMSWTEIRGLRRHNSSAYVVDLALPET